MARFCTKCGTELGPTGQCPKCPQTKKVGETLTVVKDLLSKISCRMGLTGSSEENASFFERDKQIVPDVISTNEDEVPIRQYDIARLRSRISGKWAEGKLQFTNKRVIFRATGIGFSSSGKIVLHQEFDVNEIGGIEIKKSTRFSGLNLILSFLATLALAGPFDSMFSSMVEKMSVGATLLGTLLSCIFILPFFLFKRRFWLKLIGTSFAMGIFSGLTSISSKAYNLFLGESMFEIADTLSFAVFAVWLFNIMLITFTPDLRLIVKTKGGSEAILARRKIWGLFLKQPQEYSGFSEVLPWTDTEKAINEIGTMIDDIQTMGDFAIDRWKE